MKNRVRSPYGFANINLLGACNLDCFFCLGKDLPELKQFDTNQTPPLELPNFGKFLKMVEKNDIKKIYITGLNTDPLMYEYLDDMVRYLQEEHGFFVGIRTNGILADEKMDSINRCDSVGYTLLSLHQSMFEQITGSHNVPDWSWLFFGTTTRYRVSIVVTKFNVIHLDSMIGFIKKHGFPEYIQLRRVASDKHSDILKPHMQAFDFAADCIELMALADQRYTIDLYEGAKVIKSEGAPDIVLWETVATTANSMNYFSDGTISEDYFIIEGYEKNKVVIEKKDLTG
jgi:MoaA/NifB/PqqE/SkfB family radical SAM enzyme